MVSFDYLPSDEFTQVWHWLTPTSRRMLRLTCRWAHRMSCAICSSLEGVPGTDICGVAGHPNNDRNEARFLNIKQLSISLTDLNTCQQYKAARITNILSSPTWPVFLSNLHFLRRLFLTNCKSLNVNQIQALSSACPALVALHVQRGDIGLSEGDASEPGPTTRNEATTIPDSGGRDGLMFRPHTTPPWALSGLTFAPLGCCAMLRELELYDARPLDSVHSAKPTGLPPGVMASLGYLTKLKSLALSGAAVDIDLCYCMARLTGLTRLDLELLPASWGAGGLCKQELKTPSLERFTALRVLRISLLSVDGSVSALNPGKANILRELYDMLLSANHSSIEVLDLNLPIQPPMVQASGSSAAAFMVAVTAASSSASSSASSTSVAREKSASRLAPIKLVCSPELLAALLKAGMSLQRLEVLQLRGWIRSDRCLLDNALGTETAGHILAESVGQAFREVATSLERHDVGGSQRPLSAQPLAAAASMKLPARLRLRLSITDVSSSPHPMWCQYLCTASRLELSLRMPSWEVRDCGTRFLMGPRPLRGENYPPPGWQEDNVQGPVRDALRAADGSYHARVLRWLPILVPDLYGFYLPYNLVDERAIDLIVVGLPKLQRLALGCVELAEWGRGALKPLGSLRHLTELRVGGIFAGKAPPGLMDLGREVMEGFHSSKKDTSAMDAIRALERDAHPQYVPTLINPEAILQELEECCAAFGTALPPPPSSVRPSPSTPLPSSSPALSSPTTDRGPIDCNDDNDDENDYENDYENENNSIKDHIYASEHLPLGDTVRARGMVVIVPPKGVSLEQALEVNRRLESAAATAMGGATWVPCRARLSLLERGLGPLLESDRGVKH
ncbi:hypothetical protein VaNZ11_002156 [Volvox africanus]|uniref:F-box domain-containing protein n=1 Tax=Volvox africanus TaxID=51714 RepID=A0ABQ5RRF2_9CHLO|nr:hypothetical protein VaNZ11_002156 [Volvox africanus]